MPISVILRLSLAIAISFAEVTMTQAERPNIVMITVDDMNWDSVAAFGCKVDDITPNIDRLASQGMRFQHAHVTIAICQPTRAVWMTGRYPHRNGALGFDPIDKDVPTVVEALHKGGYFTGLLAKESHVVPTRHKAFDVIVSGRNLGTGRDAKKYAQACHDFFSAAKKADKAFFLMANAQDPHRPFAGSDQERGRFKKTLPKVSRTYRADEVPLPGFLPELSPIRRELAEYYTSVHRADEVVGAIIDALDNAGHKDDTLVLFMSDHGMPLPFAKTNCWYHSTRTPLVVRWPKVVKPDSWNREDFVTGIDMTPTFLDVAGLPALEGVDGQSFVPLLKGQTQKGREYAFTSINRTAGRNEYPMRSVQDARFGYIYNGWVDGIKVFKNESQNGRTMKAMRVAAAGDKAVAARVKHFLYRTPEEFYDYEKDPDALHNLIDDPKFQDDIVRLRGILLQQMAATKDPVRPRLQKHLANSRGAK